MKMFNSGVSVTREPLTSSQLMRELVGGRAGYLQSLHDVPAEPSLPGIFVSTVVGRDPGYFHGEWGTQSFGRMSGAGAGLSREQSRNAAIGEATERFAGSIYFPDELVTGTYKSLAPNAIDPQAFISWSAEQYATSDFYVPQSADEVRRWVWGRRLSDGIRVLVPAQAVYLNYRPISRAEVISQTVSTGLACGPDLERATASGLMECLERDAFMSHWLLALAAPRLRYGADLIDLLPAELLRAAEGGGRHIDTYLLKSDHGVPTVLAVLSAGGGTQSVVGAATNFDLKRAIEKATIEALHTWIWSRTFEVSREPLHAEEVADFRDHVHFYLFPEAQRHLAFLRQGEPLDSGGSAFEPPSSVVEETCRRLGDLGYEAYAVDLTTPDLADIGLAVVKVLVPGLQPIAAGLKNYPLDPRRLRKVASFHGIEFPKELNRTPHPFP